MQNLATSFEKPPGFALTIEQPQSGYRYNQDPFHLAWFIKEHKKLWQTQLAGKCLDIGSGVGILPLLLAQNLPNTKFTGIEIQETLAQLANNNVKQNNLSSQINIINADYREFSKKQSSLFQFQSVISNPPYYPEASGRVNTCRQKCLARHEITSDLGSLTRAAALFLNNKGLFVIVFPATRLTELTTHLKNVKLEPKHLKFIHPKNSERATMLLLAARKNGAPGIIIEEPLII